MARHPPVPVALRRFGKHLGLRGLLGEPDGYEDSVLPERQLCRLT